MPFLDRAILDRQLDELEASLPQLIAETEPENVLEVFAAVADEILWYASPEDCRHVDGRIDCMLHKAGLVPGDPDEPCDIG